MWKAIVDFINVLPLIISAGLITLVIVVIAQYFKKWLASREFDKDKRHWRE